MKLEIKIILPILLFLIIVTGCFGYIFYNLKQQESVLSIEGANIRTLNSLNEQLGRQQDITDYNILGYRFNHDKTALVAVSQAGLDKSKTIDKMFPFITTQRGRELMNSYIDARKQIEPIRNELIRSIDEGDQKKISLTYNKWNIQTQNIRATLADIGAYNINSLERTLATVGDVRNKISDIIIILVFVIITIALFLFFYLRIVITVPIVKLSKFADEISRQNFTTATATATATATNNNNRKDELGMLSRAFNAMIIKLRESYIILEQKVGDRTLDLQQAKAKDDAVLASIGDGIAVADESGKIIYLNKIAIDILGDGADNATSDTWQSKYGVFDPVTQRPWPEKEMPLLRAIKGEKVIKVPLIIKNKNFPEGIFISVTATPILLNGKSIGGVAIFRDMTKEREIDKAKSEFVSLASHQLRTPLTTVSWYTEMILSGDIGAVLPKQKKYLEEIYSGNERMIDLVNTLLDVSHLELGTFQITPSPTDLIALVQSVLDEQRPKIGEKKLILKENVRSDLPIVSTDPKLLRMVLQNLLSNAVKYTPIAGIIDFNVSLNKEKDIFIKVSDTGYGIPKNQQDKIFTKLFRADNVRDKDTDGTGLGLYIVKSITENSDGKIWFESEENKGSTFYVTLPIDTTDPVRNSRVAVPRTRVKGTSTNSNQTDKKKDIEQHIKDVEKKHLIDEIVK